MFLVKKRNVYPKLKENVENDFEVGWKKKLVEVVNRQIVIFGGHLLFD